VLLLPRLHTHAFLPEGALQISQAEFPYARLVEENQRRGRQEPEFELTDTGILDGSRYFDVVAEYAKAGRTTSDPHHDFQPRPEAARLHVLPTLCIATRGVGGQTRGLHSQAEHQSGGQGSARDGAHRVGQMLAGCRPGPDGTTPQFLFTENETNTHELFGVANRTPYVKDAFHEFVVHGRTDAVNPGQAGTKAAVLYQVEIPAGGRFAFGSACSNRFRESAGVSPAQWLPASILAKRATCSPGSETPALLSRKEFDRVFQERIRERTSFTRSVCRRV